VKVRNNRGGCRVTRVNQFLAPNTGNTGVSTKQPTATKSQDPTNTGKTGVSTKA
jgi:hypothetical protein